MKYKPIEKVSDYDSHLLRPELINFPFKTAVSEILTKGRFLVSHKNVKKLCDLNFEEIHVGEILLQLTNTNEQKIKYAKAIVGMEVLTNKYKQKFHYVMYQERAK